MPLRAVKIGVASVPACYFGSLFFKCRNPLRYELRGDILTKSKYCVGICEYKCGKCHFEIIFLKKSYLKLSFILKTILIKYLEINLPKEAKDLYLETYKILMKLKMTQMKNVFLDLEE